MDEPFWMVWRENGGAPTFRHPDAYRAKNEAERLARECPGERFHVLKAIGSCVKSDVAWTPVCNLGGDDGIPF